MTHAVARGAGGRVGAAVGRAVGVAVGGGVGSGVGATVGSGVAVVGMAVAVAGAEGLEVTPADTAFPHAVRTRNEPTAARRMMVETRISILSLLVLRCDGIECPGDHGGLRNVRQS
jgi:hypothetical protein